MSTQSQDQLLKIGQVAERCGVSVDTVRAWDRDGRLPAIRTPGGQRRFRMSAVERLQTGDSAVLRGRAAGGVKLEPPVASASFPSAPQDSGLTRGAAQGPTRDWINEDPFVLEARTKLEVLRAETEGGSLQRRLDEEIRRDALQRESDRRRREEEKRLEGLKAYGRALGANLPIRWFSALTSDLESFTTRSNVPSSLPDQQAKALVAGRVERILEQLRAEEAASLSKRLASMKQDNLIRLGQQLVSSKTTFWDSREADVARSSVRRELTGQVRPDWTEADVRALVEDVLSEWVDDDDPLEDEDDDEDGVEDADDDLFD